MIPTIIFVAAVMVSPDTPVSRAVTPALKLRTLKSEARGSNWLAQYRPAPKYDVGDGVEQSLAKAERWYRQAAKAARYTSHVYLGPVEKAKLGQMIVAHGVRGASYIADAALHAGAIRQFRNKSEDMSR